MRILRALFLICGIAGLVAPALSDQNDPRLDSLFIQLKQGPGPAEVLTAEQKIWAIWLEVEDKKAAALLQTGIDAMNQDDQRAALKAFDQLVAIAPEFAEGWNKRATLHYLLGNFHESLADIAKTLALEPRHFGALSGRGLVYAKLDDPARALASFEAALAVHPHMTGARINAESLRQLLKQRDI